MFLSCDIGNSYIKIGVYDNDDLIYSNKFVHNEISFDDICNYNISHAAISSVAPAKSNVLLKRIKEQFSVAPLLINHNLNFHLKINYKPNSGLGIDRICASEGAYNLYKNKVNSTACSILILDCGTATTFNLVSSNGVYKGGIIMPGIGTMFQSLNEKAEQLPNSTPENLRGLIADNTNSAIASGVIYSTVALIEKVYIQVKAECPEDLVLIYLTGGNSKSISQNLPIEHEIIDDLVLKGIKYIYDLNLND